MREMEESESDEIQGRVIFFILKKLGTRGIWRTSSIIKFGETND